MIEYHLSLAQLMVKYSDMGPSTPTDVKTLAEMHMVDVEVDGPNEIFTFSDDSVLWVDDTEWCAL